VDGALRQFSEAARFLDTKATVLFRQGRLDEAIDLERAAAQRAPEPIIFSQFDRFLRARQARGAALLPLAAGPRHERSYRIPLPASKGPAAPFDLALLDARGCDGCQPGVWRHHLAKHDATVDAN
jgi:hypothetical protein